MLITLERNSGVPVFRQICDQIRFQVAAGVLHAGTEIPSTRDLGERLGINPMTVSKAYALLEQEGVLERRPGLPLVVRGGPDGTSSAGGDTARRDELARVLWPAVTAARQLGLTSSEAIEVYRRSLDAATAPAPAPDIYPAPDHDPTRAPASTPSQGDPDASV